MLKQVMVHGGLLLWVPVRHEIWPKKSSLSNGSRSLKDYQTTKCCKQQLLSFRGFGRCICECWRVRRAFSPHFQSSCSTERIFS